MPTYEYHCDDCDRNFDVVQSFHDDPLTTCPTCGAPVRKVFGNVGIVFKGSGFYKTDSRTGGASKVPSGGTDASPPSVGESGGTDSDTGSSTPSPSGDGSSSSPEGPSGPSATPPSTSKSNNASPPSTVKKAPTP
ncbi:MAG: FmdB family zinc ribbon protein [Acidimicrobiales bacterium]